MKRLAFLASLLIYALPVVSPHGRWTVAEVLWHGGPDVPWTIANWAAALAIQGAAFLWLNFCLTRRLRMVRILLVAPLIPAAELALYFLMMQSIPLWRLVEADNTPEHTGLAEECRLEDKWLELAGLAGRALVSKPRTEALVRSSDGSKYWRMTLPGCKLDEIPLPKNTIEQAYAPVALASGGRILYTTAKQGQRLEETGALLGEKVVALEPFRELNPTKVSPPRISPDGKAIAWIDRLSNVVEIASLGLKGLTPLARFDAKGFELVDVAEGAREVLLSKGTGEYDFVDIHGKVLSTLTLDPGVRPMFGSIRIIEGTPVYLAWEEYREKGRFVVQWRTNSGLVHKEIPRGRAIVSGDLSPDAKYIAVSTAPAVSIGQIEDAIVIWGSDGKEIFRKRLSAYSRAPVAFFAGGLVAYSQADRQGHGVTHVLKLW